MKDEEEKENKVLHAEKLNYLETKPAKENKEFNHAEYAKMVSRQVKQNKKPWENLTDKKDENKRPLVNASKEVLEHRKNHKDNKDKGRVK